LLSSGSLVAQEFDEVGIISGEGPERAAVGQLAGDRLAADQNLLHLARLDALEEIREDHLAAGGLTRLEDIEEDENDEPDDHPEGEILVEGRIHSASSIA